MRVRGSDLWPAPLTRDLVDETHHGHRLRGYPRDARTLGDVLGRAAARVPDRDAVVTRERRLTWRELRAEVDRMAGALHARHGVKPGDRVALLLLNSVDFCVGVFACARLGHVTASMSCERGMGLGDGERALGAEPRFHVPGRAVAPPGCARRRRVPCSAPWWRYRSST